MTLSALNSASGVVRVIHRRRPKSGGQTLVEFALVLPVLIAIIGGIVQFGLVFWTQNTLTQVVRDTGRWASTQLSCSNQTAVRVEADTIANSSSLFNYQSGEWTTTSPSDLTATWSSATCPTDNQTVVTVTITGNHTIPVFFPGLQYLPGFAGNRVTLSSQAVFRMEPKP